MAVSRTGQHSSVILPIIYFHPLKRPRLRLQSGLPAALPFSQESRERLHSGDNRVPFHFSKGSTTRVLGSLFGARTLIESQAFQAARITDTSHLPQREKSEGKKSRAPSTTDGNRCRVAMCSALFFPLPPSAFIFPSFWSCFLDEKQRRVSTGYSSKGSDSKLCSFVKMNKFLFSFFLFLQKMEDFLKPIFHFIYIYIYFADICKFVQKTKFYVVASRFPSTLNGSGFLYFCEKEIF